jgi:hypothetical protein
MFKGALAALALVFLQAAPAWSQTLASPEIEARANAEMSAMAGRMKVIEALESEAMDQLNIVFNQMETVGGMAGRHASKAQVAAWTNSWEPGFKAKVASIRARVAVLPDLKMDDYPSLLRSGALSGIDMPKLIESVKRRKAAVLDILTVAESVAENEKKAATGDMAAMKRTATGTLLNLQMLLTRENNSMDLIVASLPATHPNRDFANSVKESNSAMISLIRLANDGIEGRKVDAKACVADMRQHIKDGRGAANLMRDHANQAARMLETAPGTQTDLDRRSIAAANSFKDSAEIEFKLLTLIEGMAAKLDQGMEPLDAFGEGDDFERLVDQRLKLQSDRIAMLAR